LFPWFVKLISKSANPFKVLSKHKNTPKESVKSHLYFVRLLHKT
jgi:hypothetical protein